MPSETAARAGPLSDTPNERDYQAFCEALSASARGRAFLAEYARRNRNADIEQLLTATDKLQSLMSAKPETQASAALKQQLRALLDEIDAAQSELEASVLAIKATKLADLTALVERRISNLLDSLQPKPLPEPDAPSQPSDSSHEDAEQSDRTHLAVVPSPEQPELPIPSPNALQPPSIALVRSESIMAEVAFVASRPEPHECPETTRPESVARPAGDSEPVIDAEENKPAKEEAAPADPLASIMALSEEERLALFT